MVGSFFGVGAKLKIDLPKNSFNIGETITGTLTLETKKPLDAKALFVRLIGTNYEGAEIDDGEFELPESTKFFDQRFEVGGEGKYQAGQYNFQIPIPPQIPNPKKESDERERWYLRAQLDKPGLDLRDKTEVTVVTGR